jgi:two-component system sensor histidine kinase KdpD
MTDTKRASGTSAPGPVVVALGYGESGIDLVRAAGALARESGAGLDCLTIDTGEEPSAEEGERMAEALRLARVQGSRVASEPGVDLAAAILKYAVSREASALVVGMGVERRFRRSVASRLRAAGPSFPIVAVGAPRAGGKKARPRTARSIGTPAQYFAAAAIIAAVTALNLPLAGYAGYWAAAIPYLAAISLTALVLDRRPVLFAAFLSAAAWDCLFIPPRFSLRISKTEDILMLCLYFFVAICSGWMTGRLRASERLLATREARLSRLSAFAHTLAGAKTLGEIVSSSVEAVEEYFDVEAIVILRETGGGLKKQAESGWEPLDENAWSAARLCLAEGRSTGRYTDAFPDSEWRFVAMDGPSRRLGVVGVRAAHDRQWNEAIEGFLRTIVSTASIAVARELPNAGAPRQQR